MLDEYGITPQGSTDVTRYTVAELSALRDHYDAKVKKAAEEGVADGFT